MTAEQVNVESPYGSEQLSKAAKARLEVVALAENLHERFGEPRLRVCDFFRPPSPRPHTAPHVCF